MTSENISEQLNEIKNMLSTLQLQINDINKKIDNLQVSAEKTNTGVNNMNTHISFIDSVYNTIAIPIGQFLGYTNMPLPSQSQSQRQSQCQYLLENNKNNN